MLHAVHPRVVLQGEALLKREGGAPMPACHAWYCLVAHDGTVVSPMRGRNS